MKISVVIPCIPKHIYLLKNILQSLLENTVKPYEVIIYMNLFNKLKEQIKEIENIFSKVLNLVIINNKGKKYAGPSRQKGSEKVSGDIIVYLDADDLVHPQLIEIVDYFFSNYDIMHLNYTFIPFDRKFKNYNLDKIEITNSDTINKFIDDAFIHNKFNGIIIPDRKWQYDVPKIWYGSKFIGKPVPNGTTVIKKEVLDKVTWPNIKGGEDLVFCWNVAKEFRKSIIIHAALLKYSSTPECLYNWYNNYWNKFK